MGPNIKGYISDVIPHLKKAQLTMGYLAITFMSSVCKRVIISVPVPSFRTTLIEAKTQEKI